MRSGTHGPCVIDSRFRLSPEVAALNRHMIHIVRLVVYVGSTCIRGVDARNRRWSLRVTPAQDTIVRQVLKATGMSLNEYVVGCAVAAAANDLAYRRVFAVSRQVWEELKALLDGPPAAKPRIATLLAEPSIPDSGRVRIRAGTSGGVPRRRGVRLWKRGVR